MDLKSGLGLLGLCVVIAAISYVLTYVISNHIIKRISALGFLWYLIGVIVVETVAIAVLLAIVL